MIGRSRFCTLGLFPGLGRLLRDLGAAAAPAQCPACLGRVETVGKLCPSCARRLERELSRESGAGVSCGRRERSGRPGPPLAAAAPLAGVWGRLVRAYKEDPHPAVAALVEPVWADLVRRHSRRWEASGAILVPVPMARVRRRQRGFNPPERLAEIAARVSGLEAAPGALARIRYSGPLRGKKASRRRREMEGAFGSGPESDRIRRTRVILVDDVATTGATLAASASALRALGAGGGIQAWVLGRTPGPGPGRGRLERHRTGTVQSLARAGAVPIDGGVGRPRGRIPGGVDPRPGRPAPGRPAHRGPEQERCFVKS